MDRKTLPRNACFVTRRSALGLLLAPLAQGACAAPRPWFVQGPASLPGEPWASDRGAQAQAAQRRLQQWPRAVLARVVKYRQNPLRAARTLAYVQVAMHDAWLGARASGGAASELAAHRAASLLLAQLYPQEAQGRFEAAFTSLAAVIQAGEPERTAAAEAANAVADALVVRSLADGSGRVWSPRDRPADFPGAWQPAWPLHAVNPTEGLAGAWRPWVTPSAERYDPPTAARPGSAQHERETREVWEVRQSLTAQQARLAQDWHLDAGSVTPAGVWMARALDECAARAGVTFEALRATTAVAVALHDALVDCWRVKMRDWSERPITAVRRTLDPRFEPLLVTPGFPAYVSGHAAASAAAATVLAHALPERSEVFEGWAEEAAQSRLWGGIHFRSDNEEGLRLGRSVGQDVLAQWSAV